MNRDVYRYQFGDRIPLAEVRDSLFLAVYSAEGLHGPAQVRLDAAYWLDEEKRACAIDAATPVGRSISQIFTGLLTRQFGEEGFAVERIVEAPKGSTNQVPTP
jgi:hypothetical protein